MFVFETEKEIKFLNARFDNEVLCPLGEVFQCTKMFLKTRGMY